MSSACLWAAYCSGDIASNRTASSGLPMRRRNSADFRRFDPASLRVIILAVSPSMVRRECGSRPGIVASEELGTGLHAQIVGHGSSLKTLPPESVR